MHYRRAYPRIHDALKGKENPNKQTFLAEDAEGRMEVQKSKKRVFRGLNVEETNDVITRFVCATDSPWSMTRRNREVVDFKRYRVKNYSKLTNFRKFTRIEGYNGKYGSNPQGIKEFLDVFFKFDQIGREINGRNYGKWYFMKVDFKLIPRNQKSSNLDLISWRNQDLKWREIFGYENRDFS